jgi:hypothetical protein
MMGATQDNAILRVWKILDILGNHRRRVCAASISRLSFYWVRTVSRENVRHDRVMRKERAYRDSQRALECFSPVSSEAWEKK